MPTALHPQTLLTLTNDGQILPARYGFPMKLRVPTKLGYKNPKHIVAITVTNEFPGGYWENQGYNRLGGDPDPSATNSFHPKISTELTCPSVSSFCFPCCTLACQCGVRTISGDKALAKLLTPCSKSNSSMSRKLN
jgi:Oxidoreductase molybdopterin binding domain